MRERKIKEPIVSITKSGVEQQSIIEALDLLPINQIIHKGDRVVITPNCVGDKPPETATVVGPITLKVLIQYIKKYEPRKIIVATGSGSDTKTIFHSIGYDKVIEEESVEFIDLNYGPYTEIELESKIVPKTKINNLIENMDVLISFTQLKQHEEATMSAAIKNIAMGWPPGQIHGFPKKNLGIHNNLHEFIIAMANKLPIDVAIISADKTMIGTGPNNGIPVDTHGLVIASTDPVAADTIGARLLGFKPQAIHYLYKLNQSQIGETDTDQMVIKGITLEEAEKIFSKAAYGHEIGIDKS